MVLTRPRTVLLAAVLAVAATTGLSIAPSPLAAQEPVRLPTGPRFGVLVTPGPPPVVRRILPESPAERAGIRAGDELVRIDGRRATFDRIAEASRSATPGDTLRVLLHRDGEEREVLLVPDESLPDHLVVIRPDSIHALAARVLDEAREGLHRLRLLEADTLKGWIDPGTLPRIRDAFGAAMRQIDSLRMPDLEVGFLGVGPLPGAKTATLNAGLARYFEGASRGVLVTEVNPESPAARAGLEAGDVVVSANGHAVWNPGSLRAALEGGSNALTVVRRGRRIELEIERGTSVFGVWEE
ncbi:MAG: PDZ domain-containing protein [Gemmatimonadota bacterium]|nr:PDZ domain-containing protein [Gemmatimonadota bacterium]